MKTNKYEIDMCNGSIMDKLISFALPLMLSGILQLMFNAVDIIVVGHFTGKQALAAVGSTTALINVFTNLFIGISLGANVLAARFFASGREKEMSDTVHTAILLALISGILMAGIGVISAKGALLLMGTPDNVIAQSTLYMRIYFLGMPFFMLYNYGAAILRAVGDTKRPLLFLVISGCANALLDLILVIGFHLGVAGVATATITAQMISCILVLLCLYRTDSCYQLRFSKLKIKKVYLLQIFQVDYDTYESGAKYLSYFLTPATVALAVPLYEQIEPLKKNWKAILAGIFAGAMTSALCVLVLSLIFKLSHKQYVTLLPKSITTAIGMGLSEELGGIVTITVAVIIVTGVIGNMFAENICKLFHISDPVAKGVGIGSASHAMGTSKAMEMGEIEGAMSSLSIAVSGLMTVVVSLIFSHIY